MDIHDPGRDGERHPPQDQGGADLPAGRSGLARWDLATVSLILIILAVWMLTHPYRGIVHDNRIYALLAFNYLDPTAFARDVFLKHGSQDSFTVFSPLYAGAITLLGLDWSTKLLVIIGQALWILGAFALVRKMVAPRFRWLAMVFLAAYPAYYGGNSIFAIGEGFLSPRLYSEAMALAAIAAFLYSRYWLAGLLVVIGGLVHPLMMAGPAAVILTMAILHRQVWWMSVPFIAACTLILVTVMAAFHFMAVPILPAIDAEWKSIVYYRTPQFMLTNWRIDDWLVVLCDATLAWLACLRASPPIRRLLAATLSIALASVVTSFIAFDVLSDLTTGKAQIWRALWLLHVMAPICLALIIQEVSSRSDDDRRTLLGLCFSFSITASLCYAMSLPPFGVSVLMLLAILYVHNLSGRTSFRTRTLIRAGGVAILIAIFASIAFSLFLQSASPTLLSRILASILVIIVGTIVLNGLTNARTLIVSLAALSVFAAFLMWDMRSAWRRYMDSAPSIESELKAPILPGELVYWPTDVMVLWGALGNPSYFSDVQGAGTIFNRGTALEYLYRLKSVASFEPQILWNADLLGESAPAYQHGWPQKADLEDLILLCTRKDRPDVVVLGHDIPNARRETWRPRVAYARPYSDKPATGSSDRGRSGITLVSEYYLYRCTDFSAPDIGLKRAPARIGEAPAPLSDEVHG